MDENTKWRVAINQKYVSGVDSYRLGHENSTGLEKSTQVADIIVKAKDAQEAVAKGEAYIKAMKIENAFVCGVCRDGLPVTDCTEV